MTTLQTFKTAALSLALGLGALTMAPSASNAMTIYNCTTDHLPVNILHVPSNRRYQSKTLKPNQRADWNTGRGNGFRVGINVIGPDKHFSNRGGGEIISIMTIAGNTELVSGNKCQQKSAAPQKKRTYSKLDAKDVLIGGATILIMNELLKNQ